MEAGRFPVVSALAACCSTQLTYTDTSLPPHKYLFAAQKRFVFGGIDSVLKFLSEHHNIFQIYTWYYSHILHNSVGDGIQSETSRHITSMAPAM